MKIAPEAITSMDVEKDAPIPGVVSDLATLTKARLSSMVLVTTFVGYFMAAAGSIDLLTLLNVLLGTGLVAASAAVLNQYLEAGVDRLMDRTRDRPIPAGRVAPLSAVRFGSVLGVAGVVYLLLLIGPATAGLALATWLVYVFLYTPMKRRTPWCILVGAVSGALPPVIGWTAGGGGMAAGAWILFGILFLWQLPHFTAIGWMYREQYATAGFLVLPRADRGGVKAAGGSFLAALALVVVSVLPYSFGLAGTLYLWSALGLGLVFVGMAAVFLSTRNRSRALLLFFTSIIYLPLLLGAMIISKP